MYYCILHKEVNCMDNFYSENNKCNYFNENMNFNISYSPSTAGSMPYAHFHSTYEVYYFVSGNRTLFVQDKIITLPAHSLVVIPPNVLHKFISTENSPFCRLIAYFDDSIIPHHLKNDQSYLRFLKKSFHVFQFPQSDLPSVERLILPIIKEMTNKQPGFEFAIYGLFMQLLSFIFRCLDNPKYNLNSIKHGVYNKVSEIIIYINKHYQDNLSLDFLSQKFFISPSYLSRQFKYHMNFSLNHYINAVRIKEVMIMLYDNPSLNLKKAAKKAGFTSYANFNRVFKELNKCSPKEYFQKNKQQSRE